MLSFNNLELVLGGKTLFDDVSLTIHHKHKVGLIGANGTGKTSLFKIIRKEIDVDQSTISYPEGLRIFVAPVDRQVSGIWETQAHWGDAAGNLPHAFIWTALDCPGQYAFLAEGIRTGLLGRMTAKVLTAPRAGARLQVTAWTIEVSGKKHLAGSALFDERQTLLAYATTLWIGRQPLTL